MSYSIAEELDTRITHDPLAVLLKEHGLPSSGLKGELWDRISKSINSNSPNNSLTVDVLDRFIANEICHGKNRTLFISEFPKASAEPLKDINYIKECLKSKGYLDEKFNNLREISKPQDRTLAFFDYFIENDIVKKVSLCFVDALDPEDSVGDNGLTEQSNNYIWVDILVLEERIITKMWQRQTIYFDIQTTAIKTVLDEILLLIREMFSLAPRGVQSTKHVLYKIFKELTYVAEAPFRKEVEDNLSEIIKEFVQISTNKLNIKPGETAIDLPYRLHRLLERTLIQQDMDLYKHYFEGKRGYVDKIAFSDQTGARVHARAGAEQAIQVADIYFDTRDTIEQLKMLDKLWVTWFYKPNKNVNVERIDTRIEVSTEYYVIHFTRQYTNKEFVEHVLSNFKYFEELQSR